MIIDAVSDLHGHYPKLEGGDLLIVAGDLTARDLENEHALFDYWINDQKYTKKIVIAGNHDNTIQQGRLKFQFCDYLCDSGTEFEYFDPRFPEEDEGFLPSGKRTLKIWGSPWTKTFPGINPHCKAFTVETEEELEEKWKLIPNDIDILITHSPPWGILDKTIDGRNVGSISLHKHGSQRIRPILSVYGHVHEAYGETGMKNILEEIDYKFVNASQVNERYQLVNKPIRIIL